VAVQPSKTSQFESTRVGDLSRNRVEELVELACMKQEWGKLVGRVKRGEE